MCPRSSIAYPKKAMIPSRNHAGRLRIPRCVRSRPRFVRRVRSTDIRTRETDCGEIADARMRCALARSATLCLPPQMRLIMTRSSPSSRPAHPLPALFCSWNAFNRHFCRYLSRYPERDVQRLRYFRRFTRIPLCTLQTLNLRLVRMIF